MNTAAQTKQASKKHQRAGRVLTAAAMMLFGGLSAAQSLDGIDPTTYFGSRSAQRGESTHQAEYQGNTYLFRNAQSKTVFEKTPDRFVPALDGNDPFEASKGNEVAGNPSIYSVLGEQIFLFANERNRLEWLKNPDGLARRVSDSAAATDLTSVVERNSDKHNTTKKDLAVSGYDPVAYFAEGGGKPKKGNKKHSVDLDGVTYRFASEANRERFLQNPTRYEPAHGGWCSYAASKGSYAEIDPKKFLVEDGRLLLFFNGVFNDTRKKWLASDEDLLPAADSFWLKESGESARQG